MRNCFISIVACLTFSTAGYLLVIINHAFRGEIAYLQTIDLSGFTKRRKKNYLPRSLRLHSPQSAESNANRTTFPKEGETCPSHPSSTEKMYCFKTILLRLDCYLFHKGKKCILIRTQPRGQPLRVTPSIPTPHS